MSQLKNKKPKANIGILIDAKNNKFSYVEIKHYTDLYMHGRFITFTSLSMGKDDTLYVDDEGLINGTGYGFKFDGYSTPLMGNGIVLGSNPNTDDYLPAHHTIDEIIKRVKCFVVESEKVVQHPAKLVVERKGYVRSTRGDIPN
jgi:hypothetical protein